MPTLVEVDELINNTKHSYTSVDGVIGRKFVSTTDTSTSIFVPSSGIYHRGSLSLDGSGHCWSSSWVAYSKRLEFNERLEGPAGRTLYIWGMNAASHEWSQSDGLSVRGVLNPHNRTYPPPHIHQPKREGSRPITGQPPSHGNVLQT